ncbi:23S rRNA (pseudouridine(1915)-N(3))-methyltransferase RlmH [Novispirillum itersonii]|uniref:Ribosomal RNA large subunit methyltransferase H n=1 Tax=Novispirillum itersonii TaxID=189 RepID=A0A7W9ZKT1_NOVIT|nr:23S rRNA (pseudouridine(1915)-N(3))-methyltransferase RlmH [Novispirillum itersonii]MBB6212054.1 23S rRNA (pseudouridine1915-N3)-methyltransferase [Novispirillum itersonii]
MQALLAAVGRSKAGPERSLFEHYAGRLRGGITVREVEEKRPLPVAERMAREGELLLGCVPAGARVVALDERGKALDSRTFADRLGRWRDEAVPSVAFLIGGADGHSDAVRQRADLLLSFGVMTWPHMLVRGLLAEQLYRAQCILDGHPYHRD